MQSFVFFNICFFASSNLCYYFKIRKSITFIFGITESCFHFRNNYCDYSLLDTNNCFKREFSKASACLSILFESITKGIREGESCFTDFTTERMFSGAELKCGRAKTLWNHSCIKRVTFINQWFEITTFNSLKMNTSMPVWELPYKNIWETNWKSYLATNEFGKKQKEFVNFFKRIFKTNRWYLEDECKIWHWS